MWERTVPLWLALISVIGGVHSAHILGLLINGIRSHLLVYGAVARVLLERGHRVTLVTTLPLDDMQWPWANTTTGQLRHIQLAEGYTSVTKTQTAAAAGVLARLQQSHNYIEHASAFLADPVWQQFLAEGQKFDLLLLGYHFNDYQLGVAAHFNCPVVLVWPGPPISYVHSLVGNPELRWYVPQPYDRHQRRGFAAWTFGLWEKATEWLARRVMRRIYDLHFPASHYPSFDEVRRNVSVVFCNHDMPSEGPIAAHVPGIIGIGGIQQEQSGHDAELVDRAASHENIIYCSLGTRVRWSRLPAALRQHFIDTFRELTNYSILWAYDGSDCAAIQTVAPNVQCAKWWPQASVLASQRTKLFITHGGKASISEALYHGVPLLVLPLVGDQRANAVRATHKGLALMLPMDSALTSQQLMQAAQQLLQNSSFAARAAHYAQLYRDRPLNATATAAYWLEYVLRHRGAVHMQSPAVRLTAWQYYNFDVLAALLLSCLGACCCIAWLERRLLSPLKVLTTNKLTFD